MPTSAKGVVQLALENANNPGPQTGIVSYATIATTMSAGTQPRATSTGMRLLIKVYNAVASGTITVAGTDINGNSISETTPTIPASAPSQQANVNWFEYVTTHAYATINSNGITCSAALVGATLIIDGIQSGKYKFPSILKAKTKYDTYSPDESRGLLDRDTRVIQLTKHVSIDSLEQILYTGNSLWWPYTTFTQSPTITTNPSTPTVLQASTSLITLTPSNQPNYPSQMLIFTITGSSATGSFTVAGLNQYGVSVTETINCTGNGTNGNGTYYSYNCYSSINTNGIAGVSGLTSASIAISGVYNWIYAFVPGDSIYSMALEWFTGSESYTFPWTLIQESTLELDPKKGVMLTAKGMSQNQLAIGNRASNLTTSNLVSQVDSMPKDIPLGGWQANCYIDAQGATLLSGFYGDIISGKVAFKTPVEGGFNVSNTQLFSRVLRGRREVEADLTVDLSNGTQLEQFRQNTLQYFSFQIYGTTYGAGQGGQWTFTIPFYYEDAEVTSVPSDNRVKANFKFKGVYDGNLGGSIILTLQSQMPPIYPN